VLKSLSQNLSVKLNEIRGTIETPGRGGGRGPLERPLALVFWNPFSERAPDGIALVLLMASNITQCSTSDRYFMEKAAWHGRAHAHKPSRAIIHAAAFD